MELPPEAVAIINENGQRMLRRDADNIQSSVDCMRRNGKILKTKVAKDKRKKKQQDDIKKILKTTALVGLGVIAAASLIASGIGMVATVTAATGMSTTQGATVVAAGITGTFAVSAAKGKNR
jgi:hypothetical protein